MRKWYAVAMNLRMPNPEDPTTINREIHISVNPERPKFTYVEVGNTRFSVDIQHDHISNAYVGKINFTPYSLTGYQEYYGASSARCLAHGLLGLYELTQHEELLQPYGINLEGRGIDLYAITNQTLIDAIRNIFAENGYNPDSFAPTETTKTGSRIVYLLWNNLKNLAPDDPVVEYLHRIAGDRIEKAE